MSPLSPRSRSPVDVWPFLSPGDEVREFKWLSVCFGRSASALRRHHRLEHEVRAVRRLCHRRELPLQDPLIQQQGCIADQRDQPQSAVESGMSRTEESAHAAASISTADIRSTTATASGGDPFPGRNRRAATNNSKPDSENCAKGSRNDFTSDKTEPEEGVLL